MTATLGYPQVNTADHYEVRLLAPAAAGLGADRSTDTLSGAARPDRSALAAVLDYSRLSPLRGTVS